MTLDGTTGEVFIGEMPLSQPKISGELNTFLSWTDDVRLKATREGLKQKGINVRTNADTPADAKRAREFGAEGIGLCRTEHMFFEEDKIFNFRQMILAEDLEARKKALKKILPLQKKDFRGIFKAMAGLPVTIRLLDPPLHEFVPHETKEIKELAAAVGISRVRSRPRSRASTSSTPCSATADAASGSRIRKSTTCR